MKRKPFKIWNFYDDISRRGKSSREPKAPSALLRAQTYRKGEQRGQTADPISFLPLESVLAAGERKEIQITERRSRSKDLMQDSPPWQTLERSLAVLVRHEP